MPSYLAWLNFDRASKRGGSRGSAQKVEMTSQLGKLGAAMEDRELAALASVKNPYRIKQQSLVVKNGKSVQQLAWKNAGAVADPNVFNHPVHTLSSMHVDTANSCASVCAGVRRVERAACACSHALHSLVLSLSYTNPKPQSNDTWHLRGDRNDACVA